MASSKQLAEAWRRATRIHRAMAEDILRSRDDAGLSGRQLAKAAGIDAAYLRRIEDGSERPTIDTYSKVALALGSDLSSRLYPNTGPTIRDRHQARILEALIRGLDARWRPYPEVAVRHPSRGWIDALLHDTRASCVVATEIQSDLRRLEQLLRWFPEKVASLSSWEGWPHVGDIGTPSRLLIVRATKATRQVAREFELQLSAAYPAHPADALSSLMGATAWPGAALVWARIEPQGVRFLDRR